MASLLITSEGFRDQVIELKLGITRVGRSPEKYFRIDRETVSAIHCELVLAADELVVRDCGSTNGTFLGDERIEEAKLQAGQSLRLGDIELLVETTEGGVA